MILALDTSTPTCMLYIYDEGNWHTHSWESGRGLAKGLLRYIGETVGEYPVSSQDFFSDVTGIVAYQGPGSFTGLRIGLTVLNTIASAKNIPIVGMTGDGWQENGRIRLNSGENDQLVMPEYGGEPHITTPRK